MLPKVGRSLKQALWWSRIKLIYSRITLNRFTTLYFFFALLNCVVLVVLQGIAYADNSKAVDIIKNHSLSHGNNTYGQPGTNKADQSGNDTQDTPRPDMVHDDDSERSLLRLDGLVKIYNRSNSKGDHQPNTSGKGSSTSQQHPCKQFLGWLRFILDAHERREDIVILSFNVWLLSLAVVTILSESLPHLGASLVGHVFGTVWAVYRASDGQLRAFETSVMGTCHLQDWRRVHDIHVPILVINVVTLLAMTFLSFKLFNFYASQSFGRVGSSARVSKVYKIVLVFSACLQLAVFFSLASASIWIDLVSNKFVQSHNPGQHMHLYLVAFIVTLLLLLPWLYLGWVSVRKEGRRQFLAFSHISVFLIVVYSLMFFSDVYQNIFQFWSFFAMITVTAFILTVSTTFLGIWCCMNFGRGLSQYLQATHALDDVDFTPETFRNDSENGNTYRIEESRPLDEKQISQIIIEYINQPQVAHRVSSRDRGQSIFSEKYGTPLKLSSTPSLFQERDRDAAKAESSARSFGRNHLSLGSDGYKFPQMPPRSVTPTSPYSRRSRDLTPSPNSSFASPMSPSMFARPTTPIAPPGFRPPQV